MIEYIYHFDYLRNIDFGPEENNKRAQTNTPDKSSPGNPASSPPEVKIYVVEHAKVFAMGAKYQIDGLCDLAVGKFRESAIAYWGSHDDIAIAISLVYNSTPGQFTQLRETVADTSFDHTNALQDERIEALLDSMPGLAYALLKRSRDKIEKDAAALSVPCRRGDHYRYKTVILMCHNCTRGSRVCSDCHNGAQDIQCTTCPNRLERLRMSL